MKGAHIAALWPSGGEIDRKLARVLGDVLEDGSGLLAMHGYPARR